MQLITKDFERQALAFPDRVEQALAHVETIQDAKDILDKAAVMQQYAERLKAGIEIEKPIAIGVLKIKAKIGELLPRGKGGRGNKTPIGGVGVFEATPTTIAAYRKLADHKDKLEEYIESSDDVPTQSDFIKFATGKHDSKSHVSNNSGENEWYTPSQFIELAREAMGGIDLDPATSELAQETVCAERFFTIADDGLGQDWHGRVWMNPPYSKDLIGKFAAKMCEHVGFRDIEQAVVLVNNATETSWFQLFAREASAICFPSGRIQFVGKSGKKNSPLQGQAFIYFGQAVERFTETFKSIGFVCEIHRGNKCY